MLPIKTTFDDIASVVAYLRNQVGWVEIDKVRKAIPPKHTDNRKVEAMRFIGLVERDGNNIKLSDAGRQFAGADDDEQAQILRVQIRGIGLYHATFEWIHFNKKAEPTRTEVANYWHDNHQTELQGSKGAALTDAVIFFLRLAGAARLGKFIAAGKGRPETYLKVDSDTVREYVEGRGEAPPVSPSLPPADVPSPVEPSAGAPPGPPFVTTTPGVHVNVEIHIAADAKAATIEEIFKNMRRYVLNRPDDETGGAS